jgi:hypothetical protein
LLASWEGQTTKIAGFGSASGSESGSIGQRYGSADPDPDPPQNVMNPHNADPDPGSGAFRPLDPGSRTGFSGSRISDTKPIFLRA